MPQVIQSLLLDRNYYTLPEAKRWVKRHGYRLGDFDTTKHYFRFKQFRPMPGAQFRMHQLSPSLRSVMQVNMPTPMYTPVHKSPIKLGPTPVSHQKPPTSLPEGIQARRAHSASFGGN